MKKHLTCFDIPALIKQDIMDIMLDFGYTLIAMYDEEIAFEKIIDGERYVVSFEPNKHTNTRYADRIFKKVLALKHLDTYEKYIF